MLRVCSASTYQLKKSVAAVQLTGVSDGIPKLTYLVAGTIARVKADGSVVGFVQVLCGDQMYNVFLEDLQERGERINNAEQRS